MPHVLQIHDKPEGGGGIARVVADFAAGLRARGWSVGELRLSRRPAAGAVATRPGRRARAGDAGVSAVAAAAAGADAVILHLGYSLLSPDLVRAAASGPGALFIQLHDVSPFCPNGLRLTWPGGRECRRREGIACLAGLCAGRGSVAGTARAGFRLAARRTVWAALCREAAGFLAPSRYLAQAAAHAGAPAGRVHLLPHPVTMDGDDPVAPASSGEGIAYVGLLSAAKGAPLLLEAVARLPGARLVLFGDGPAAASLRDRAARPDLAGRVQFAGTVDRATLRAGLLRARVLAHPSLVPEGLGLAGIEAMALGRPVAGFGRGGSADWLIDGTTGLVAAADPAALAAALGRLVADPALADRLGAAARAHVAATYAPGPALDALSARLGEGRRR